MIITRYNNIEKIETEVEFLTPAFLGGADQNAELRTAPFKTALRFWWRALYAYNYKNFIDLKSAEDEIFGSTEKSSKVKINLIGSVDTEKVGFPEGIRINVTSKGRTFQLNILDYLAYGHYKYERGRGNLYQHTYIKPNQRFKLSIMVSKQYYETMIKVTKYFIYFGGIGSKSRNGFGSLNSNLIKDFNIDSVKNFNNEPLAFSAFSNKSKLFVTNNSFDNWENALSKIAISYKNARTSLENKHSYATRGLISRPIEVRGENISANIKNGRHPKPFFISIKKVNNKYKGQILCLPIKFYEEQNVQNYDDAIKKMLDIFRNDQNLQEVM